MLNSLKREELVKMPLHLQILFLLNLWSNGEGEANVAGGDQLTA